MGLDLIKNGDWCIRKWLQLFLVNEFIGRHKVSLRIRCRWAEKKSVIGPNIFTTHYLVFAEMGSMLWGADGIQIIGYVCISHDLSRSVPFSIPWKKCAFYDGTWNCSNLTDDGHRNHHHQGAYYTQLQHSTNLPIYIIAAFECNGMETIRQRTITVTGRPEKIHFSLDFWKDQFQISQQNETVH